MYPLALSSDSLYAEEKDRSVRHDTNNEYNGKEHEKTYDGEERFDERNEDDNEESGESFRDIGKTIGWVTIGFLSLAVLPYIMRRSVKLAFPDNTFIGNLTNSFKGSHYIVGICVVILAAVHGLIMILGEDKDVQFWIGVAAGVSILFIFFAGVILKLRKKYLRFSLMAHKVILLLLIILVTMHIID